MSCCPLCCLLAIKTTGLSGSSVCTAATDPPWRTHSPIRLPYRTRTRGVCGPGAASAARWAWSTPSVAWFGDPRIKGAHGPHNSPSSFSYSQIGSSNCAWEDCGSARLATRSSGSTFRIAIRRTTSWAPAATAGCPLGSGSLDLCAPELLLSVKVAVPTSKLFLVLRAIGSRLIFDFLAS